MGLRIKKSGGRRTSRIKDSATVRVLQAREKPGKGETAPAPVQVFVNPSNIRSDVTAVIQTLEDHSVRRIPVSADMTEKISKVTADLLAGKLGIRGQRAGARLALAALKYNLAVLEFADKAARLDAGKPTVNVDHTINVPISNPDVLRSAINLERRLRESPGSLGPPTDARALPDTTSH